MKERILERAEEMFLRYGFKSVTMDDLASDLGISKKTLYTHVVNKTDLIDQITSKLIQDHKSAMEEMAATADNALHEMVLSARFIVRLLRRMSPKTIYSLKKYYRAQWNKIDAFHFRYIYNIIRTNVVRGIEEGLYRDSLDPDIIAKLYVGKSMLLADETLFPTRDYEREALFIQYFNYHVQGIASKRGLTLLRKYQDSLSVKTAQLG